MDMKTKAHELSYNLKAIIISLYGRNAEKLKDFDERINKITGHISVESIEIAAICLAFISNIKFEVDNGLLKSLELIYSGNVLSDLVEISTKSLDESLPVSAVLISAALEDALKTLARSNDLTVEDKTMEDVINALSGKGLIPKRQKEFLEKYKNVRNDALHANWEKLNRPVIEGMITFTESFIAHHLI